MNSLSNTIQVSKPTYRFYGFITDRVFITLVMAFSGLAILDRIQAYQSLRFTLQSMIGIAPFFFLAVAFAGYAKATGFDSHIARVFSGKSWVTIIAASLAGALSPFCSCGVIPLIAVMLASGVPLAPVMAFCISSPIMDPEMFILTASGISLKFAIAKTIAAIGMGLATGFTVIGLQQIGFLFQPLKRAQGCSCCQPSFDANAKVEVFWRFWQKPERRDRFMEEIINNGVFLGKWMFFAFFLESIMIAYLPAEWIASVVGNKNTFAVPLASIVGIPAYINGYAAIPLISGLMKMGMTSGAAMAFITSGAVSSIPAALAVYALVRKSIFVLYIFFGLFGSMLAGYIFQISVGI
ncbi:MAG: permease [Deltaproteobacteria bacterium]|nr:MAG: permease [Deltaproteobacteria bacterium]